MTDRVLRFRPLDPDAVEVLLCDADGNLFASEEPAFVASTAVTNKLLAMLGIDHEFTPDVLRRCAVGRNFRSTAEALAAEAGKSIDPDALESWVVEEQRAVVAELGSVLRPNAEVTGPLRELATRFRLAVVSSSAQARLDACFQAAGLDELFPRAVRFSAEDSLPVPTSKPDPAIYGHAAEALGIELGAGLAVEDAAVGARSAIGAGFTTVGNLQFVAPAEREQRIAELRDAGVAAIVSSWSGLTALLTLGAGVAGSAQGATR